MNEYEYKRTKAFEGIYTPEEIELNKRLYDECMKRTVDLDLVEQLLREGADPLGATAEKGWDLLLHVYGEVALESGVTGSINLPKITELFLKYGMDVASPRIPYDEDDSIHPLRFFPFNENAVASLKMILDRGVKAEDACELWAGEVDDQINVCRDDPNSEEWRERFHYFAKTVMLIASYEHILEDDEGLRDFIGYRNNSYDVRKFREWNNFYYEFDTSRCKSHPELRGAVIRIYEKRTDKQVWQIVVYPEKESFN